MKITLIVKDRVVGVVVPIAVWPKLKAIVWQFCETSKYTAIKMNMNWIWVSIRVSIAVVFVIFAVEFMNTTANSTKTTAINDNAQIFFVFLANLSHLEQKKISKNFSKIFFNKIDSHIFFQN